MKKSKRGKTFSNCRIDMFNMNYTNITMLGCANLNHGHLKISSLFQGLVGVRRTYVPPPISMRLFGFVNLKFQKSFYGLRFFVFWRNR